MVWDSPFSPGSQQGCPVRETEKPTTCRERSQAGVGCQAVVLASSANYGCDEGYDGLMLFVLLRAFQYNTTAYTEAGVLSVILLHSEELASRVLTKCQE